MGLAPIACQLRADNQDEILSDIDALYRTDNDKATAAQVAQYNQAYQSLLKDESVDKVRWQSGLTAAQEDAEMQKIELSYRASHPDATPATVNSQMAFYRAMMGYQQKAENEVRGEARSTAVSDEMPFANHPEEYAGSKPERYVAPFAREAQVPGQQAATAQSTNMSWAPFAGEHDLSAYLQSYVDKNVNSANSKEVEYFVTAQEVREAFNTVSSQVRKSGSVSTRNLQKAVKILEKHLDNELEESLRSLDNCYDTIDQLRLVDEVKSEELYALHTAIFNATEAIENQVSDFNAMLKRDNV